MTPEQQRIAIAQWCGWVRIDPPEGSKNIWGAQARGKQWWFTHQLPDYCSDLNAIHEAEKKITGDNMHIYVIEVGIACGTSKRKDYNFDMIHATAAQRSEALLRTLNLWTDKGGSK